MSNVYIIGASNVDIYARVNKDIIARDSNPSRISFSYGGVARNICENLANFNIPTTFCSVFGNDAFSKEMYDYLRNKGVDLSYSLTSIDHISPIYIAIMDKDDLYLGTSDMDILKSFSIEQLEKLSKVITEEDILIFDTDFNDDKLSYIFNNIKGIKVIDAISANKVVKLRNYLDKIDILKLNKIEAETLLGTNYESKELSIAAKRVHELGVKKAIISDKNDIFVAMDEIYHYVHHAYREKPVNVTGAGDSLLAGIVYGVYNRLSIDDTVKFALSTAIQTVDEINSVANLNVNKVLNYIDEALIERVMDC